MDREGNWCPHVSDAFWIFLPSFCLSPQTLDPITLPTLGYPEYLQPVSLLYTFVFPSRDFNSASRPPWPPIEEGLLLPTQGTGALPAW